MPRACSQDLRDRVIALVEEGVPRQEAARRFRVNASTVVRWVQAWKQGRRTPLPRGGDHRSLLPPHREWLLELVKAENDLTLAQISARLLAERGVYADVPTLCRFFQAQGISYKKNRSRR